MSAALSKTAHTSTRHVIDLDADPFVLNDWKVEEHKKGGHLEWDASKVARYLDPRQQHGVRIEGHTLRKALVGKPVLNANVLDYLLKNPQLIPDEWEGKQIFFWGTVYLGLDGYLYVRCLYWDGDRWDWDYFWLDRDWLDCDPAAVLAN